MRVGLCARRLVQITLPIIRKLLPGRVGALCWRVVLISRFCLVCECFFSMQTSITDHDDRAFETSFAQPPLMISCSHQSIRDWFHSPNRGTLIKASPKPKPPQPHRAPGQPTSHFRPPHPHSPTTHNLHFISEPKPRCCDRCWTAPPTHMWNPCAY